MSWLCVEESETDSKCWLFAGPDGDPSPLRETDHHAGLRVSPFVLTTIQPKQKLHLALPLPFPLTSVMGCSGLPVTIFSQPGCVLPYVRLCVSDIHEVGTYVFLHPTETFVTVVICLIACSGLSYITSQNFEQ